MGKFIGKWAVEEYGPRLVKTTKFLSYTDDKGITHEVEIGFVHDGGSIPPILWPIIGSPFVGRYRKSVTIHDKLCETQEFSRSYTDKVFLQAMRDEGVVLWRRRAMWLGVRAGGWRSWNKNAKILQARKLAAKILKI